MAGAARVRMCPSRQREGAMGDIPILIFLLIFLLVEKASPFQIREYFWQSREAMLRVNGKGEGINTRVKEGTYQDRDLAQEGQ